MKYAIGKALVLKLIIAESAIFLIYLLGFFFLYHQYPEMWVCVDITPRPRIWDITPGSSDHPSV